MPCKPISVSLEVNPNPRQKIIFSLDKSCNVHDEATWQMDFELQEGHPLATIVKLHVKIDPQNHPQAEATANFFASARRRPAMAGATSRTVGTSCEPKAKAPWWSRK